MPFPTKDYHRLQSLKKRWGVSKEDLYYAVENGLLRTCIWLPLRYVERGVIKNRKFIYESHEAKEGFVGVRPEDCRRICNSGRARLRTFTSIRNEKQLLRLAYEPPQPAISVRLHELIVLNDDLKEFEQTYDLSEASLHGSQSEKFRPQFHAAEDYRWVQLGDMEFHLGDVQSRIVEQLHDAAQSHNPWVHGKTLIYESGSHANKLRDIFKNKKNWRKLIHSDERGRYRLNIPGDHRAEMPKSIDRSSAAEQAAA